MILIDLTHTSHTTARTGIQRVCRSLTEALQQQTEVLPVTHDRYRRVWRRLKDWENDNLTSTAIAQGRGARWPWRARLSSHLHRWLRHPAPLLPDVDGGIVVPEIFSPTVARALPTLFAHGGPRIAIFHDAIPLRLPEMTPPATVARFPAYLQELRLFDGVAAVSADSRAALLDYWAWLGVRQGPPVITLPLGIETLPPRPPRSAETDIEPVVLCVGSIEGRKNHRALLRACESLWAAGRRFSLHLIGLPRPETAADALALIQELQARGRPIRFVGPVDDAALAQAYLASTFTVYPSLMEGFGLPVVESLQHGRPCICSNRGALGESAGSGGCLALDEVSETTLSTAIAHLLDHPEERERLEEEADRRPFRRWHEYARELRGWMRELRRR